MRRLSPFLIPGIALGFLWHPGTTGSTFLKLGVGARPVAMGGAYTAIVDDANALFWNPAGLGMAQRFEGSCMLMRLFGEVNYHTGGLAIPLRRFGFGIGGAYLSAHDTRWDEYGRSQGSFRISDLAVGLGGAYKPFRNLSFGAGLKFINSRLAEYVAISGTLDLGVIFTPSEHLYLGSAIRNLGPPRRFLSRWEYPPTNLRGGMGLKLRITEHRLILAADLSLYPDAVPTLSLGGEFRLRLGQKFPLRLDQKLREASALSVRAGYQSGYHLGSWSGVSFGIGYEYRIAERLFLVIDAVHHFYGWLGGAERLSISLASEPSVRPRRPPRTRPPRSR